RPGPDRGLRSWAARYRGHKRPPDCPWATRGLRWKPGPARLPAGWPGGWPEGWPEGWPAGPWSRMNAACRTPCGAAGPGARCVPAPAAQPRFLIAEAQAEGITAAYVAIDVVESVNIP